MKRKDQILLEQAYKSVVDRDTDRQRTAVWVEFKSPKGLEIADEIDAHGKNRPFCDLRSHETGLTPAQAPRVRLYKLVNFDDWQNFKQQHDLNEGSDYVEHGFKAYHRMAYGELS
jgi:hypothetical protein